MQPSQYGASPRRPETGYRWVTIHGDVAIQAARTVLSHGRKFVEHAHYATIGSGIAVRVASPFETEDLDTLRWLVQHFGFKDIVLALPDGVPDDIDDTEDIPLPLFAGRQSVSRAFLSDVTNFLRANYPGTALIPTKANSPSAPPDTHKQPLWQHKGVPDADLHEQWDRQGISNSSKGAVMVLRPPPCGSPEKQLFVVDVDDHRLAARLVDMFPSLASTAQQETRNGVHFIMHATEAVVAAGPSLRDCAGQIYPLDAAEVASYAEHLRPSGSFPIDIKTATTAVHDGITTGGVISIFPSPGKMWKTGSMFLTPPAPVPDGLVQFLAMRRKAASTARASRAPRSNNTAGEHPSGHIDIEEVARLVAALGLARADNWQEWMEVGWCLKNISASTGVSLLHLWIAHSRRSAKFKNTEECERLWSRMDERPAGDGLHMGTLIQWANSDREVEAARREAEVMDRQMWAVMPRVHAALYDEEPPLDMELVEKKECGKDGAVLSWTYRRAPADPNLTRMTLNTDSLEVTTESIDESTGRSVDRTVTFLHRERSLPSVSDITMVHKDLPRTESWSVSRPTDAMVLFSAASAMVELHCMNKSAKDRTARAIWNQTGKSALISKRRDVNVLESAYMDAIRHAVEVKLAVGSMVNVVGDNNVVMLNTAAGADGDDNSQGRQADVDFYPMLVSSGLLADIVAIDETRLYVCNDGPAGQVWTACSVNEAAVKLRMAARPQGVLHGLLGPADQFYLKSCNGAINVLKSCITEFKDPSFVRKLDQKRQNCLPFNNGMLDNGVLRPIRRDEYVSQTIGYDYVPKQDVDPAHTALIEDAYAKFFPEPDERAYFAAYMGRALMSERDAKSLLLLVDERDGSNGKSTLMRGVEIAMGEFTAKTERDFLYTSTASGGGSSPNLLEYMNKRLAFYDEPSKDGMGLKTLDVQKIKDLTSGVAFITGRYHHANVMIKARFNSCIVIACNENNFPKFDASETAFIKRLKPIKMRSLFVPPDKYAVYQENGEEHVYMESSADWIRTFEETRMAHLHYLLDAWEAAAAASVDGFVLNEPPCVREMVDAITSESDPRLQVVLDFIRTAVDLNPARPANAKHKKHYAVITHKDLQAEFMAHWERGCQENTREFKLQLTREQLSRGSWSGLLKFAMGRLGKNYRPRLDFESADGREVKQNGYDRCAWKAQHGPDDADGDH